MGGPVVLVIVGDTQPAAGEPPLRGPTGTRLFTLARRYDLLFALKGRRPLESVDAEVRALNLFDVVPCARDSEEPCVACAAEIEDGSPDMVRALHHELLELVPDVEDDDLRLVVLGKRAARALGLSLDYYLRFARDERFGLVAWVPHPSGRNRWWNDPRHSARGRAFLREALAPREASA